MPAYELTVRISSLARSPEQTKSRLETVLRDANFKDVAVLDAVKRPPVATSRAERLAEAMDQIDSALSTIEDLKSELEDWHSNLPENLQSSQKADELQEAIDALEELHSSIDSARGDADNVQFPSMM